MGDFARGFFLMWLVCLLAILAFLPGRELPPMKSIQPMVPTQDAPKKHSVWDEPEYWKNPWVA